MSVQDEVFTLLRRMTPGNPSCGNREERLDYIRDCTRGSMILLDVYRNCSPPRRRGRRGGDGQHHRADPPPLGAPVPVVVCFRGVKDVVESEEDPRHHICFPELSREMSAAPGGGQCHFPRRLPPFGGMPRAPASSQRRLAVAATATVGACSSSRAFHGAAWRGAAPGSADR